MTGVLLLLAGCVAPGEEPAFQPDVLFVEGVFGYDAAQDAAVAYTVDGEVVPPTLILGLATSTWFQTGAADERCDVVARHDPEGGPLPRAPWAAELAFGFDLPADLAVESGCEGFWGDPAATLLAGRWGLGVGPVDEALAAELEDAVVSQGGAWEADWAPVLLGGGFYWSEAEDAFPEGFVPHDYAFAAAVDEDLRLVLDEEGQSVTLPAADVVDGAPPSGAYILRSWFGVDADLAAP